MAISGVLVVLAAAIAVDAFVTLPEIEFNTPGSGKFYLAPGAFSEQCSKALFEFPIDCHDSLRTTKFNSTADELRDLCTPTCLNSVDDFLAQAKVGCAAARYTNIDGQLAPAWKPAQELKTMLGRHCLQQSDGEYCMPILASFSEETHANITYIPFPSCHECMIRQMRHHIESEQIPLRGRLFQQHYSSITSSCGVSTLTPTVPVQTPWLAEWATETPIPHRPGSVVEVFPIDTCQQLSLQLTTSTHRLLAANNLGPSCEEFPMRGFLLLPNDDLCVSYPINRSSTLEAISAERQIAVSELIRWNPELVDAGLFESYAKSNYSICVSDPGKNPYENLAPPQRTNIPLTGEL